MSGICEQSKKPHKANPVSTDANLVLSRDFIGFNAKRKQASAKSGL